MKPILVLLTGLTLLAADSEIASLEKYTPAERRHWSFQPRKQIVPPAVSGTTNSIDAFIRARLQKDNLQPAPAADRETLIRRVTFDLHGLPPTPQEIQAFVSDASPDAYTKLIDRLLASPRYGEHWGRHWLDVVRFAESDGFEYDTHRHDAWRYRDYVIHSFNIDKPYTQFIHEQLAGDEMNPRNEVMRIASGYNRLGPLRKNAGNQEVASSRNEVLTEMTNIVGASLLGVTLGCARCHDHKFDPIRHTDYYRMQGYFSATFDEDVPLTSEEVRAEWKKKTDTLTAEIKEMQQQMKKLTGSAKEEMGKKVKATEAKLPAPLPSLFSTANDYEKATPIHVLARGEYTNKGAKVGMRPLGVLLPPDTPELPSDTQNPRMKLADWISDPENPLTARVMVNRIWGYHFGRGIVATPNDFGRMGTRPSHPELLDWLANQFVEGGWKVKPIHRMILMSETYRQSSESPIEDTAMTKDAENKLLWKFNRRRLEAEEIRDASLTVAGRLNEKAGGPSIIVPIDPDLTNFLYKPSQWAVTADAKEHNRRSVYLFQKRNLRLPFMEVFDSPDLQISCPRREQSTHAPQALELLNGDFANAMADSFAKRLEQEAKDNNTRIDLAYLLATGRHPATKEKAIAQQFLASGSLREFALAILNLNSFLYVN